MINDCPNGDMRDLLPDLVHGRLDDATRAAVQAHLAGCADCRAEVDLIWAAARSLSQAPRVDVRRIVAALPAPATVRARPARSSFRLGGWQRAAAVAAVAAGLLTVGVWQSGEKTGNRVIAPRPDSGPVAQGQPDSPALPGRAGDTPRMDAPATAPKGASNRRAPASESPALLAADELSDLSADQLESVLASLDDIDGIPSAEPEPVAMPTPLAGGARLQ